MKSFKSILFIAFVSGLLLLTSCGDDDPTPALEATLVENLAADPATAPPSGPPPVCYTCKYTLFSFSSGEIVANADSATSNWDIGFRGTSIIINSGTSGPSTAAAQVVEGIFDEYLTAPDAGYLQDNKNTPSYAISGWYTYANYIITATAGKIIVVKTASGKYAKVEILSYYKNAPVSPDYTTDEARYYTFRYIYQPNGSKSFK